MADRRRLVQYWGLFQEEIVGHARDLVELAELEDQRERAPRRWWVKPYLQRRVIHGEYDALLSELMIEDPDKFKQVMRIDVATFHEILTLVAPTITKQTTNAREPISPGHKLAFTIRFLATGYAYRDLGLNYRVSHSTMSTMVVPVCQAMLDIMGPDSLKIPTEPEEWQAVADRFQQRWQFPHTLGAIDGKHIAIQKPAKSGSLYFNYKGFFSIVLMGIADADYKFLWVQVGDVGSSSDGQIWNHCEVRQALQAGVLGIPQPDPLPGDDINTPYYMIGDDAFGMRTWLMKPFSRRGMQHDEMVFNYRLSRARRVVENAFGILANRFRCLLSAISIDVENVPVLVRTCVMLHNFLRTRNPGGDADVEDHEDEHHNLIPGAWRNDVNLLDMNQRQGGNRDTREAKRQRLYLKHYINSPRGSVPWQEHRL